MEKELLGIVSAALGVDETEVTETLQSEDGPAKLKTQVEDFIATGLADAKKSADGRALKSTRNAVEKALKSVGIDYKFDPDKAFDLNVSAALESYESKVAESAGQSTTLTDEQILKLPQVVKLKNELTLDAERRETAAREQERESLKKEREDFTRQQTENQVRSKFKKELAVLNPIFSADAKRAANQAQDLEDKVAKAGPWQTEGDETYLLDEDGEIKKDRLGKPVTLSTFTREVITNYYDLPVATPKQNAGLTPEQVNTPQPTYAGPKSEEEYQQTLSKLNTPQERADLSKLWKERPQEPVV